MGNNITFTPEHKQLSSIFGESTRYIIPSYQRPYSWESLGSSDKNNQVNNLWDDLVEFFEANSNKADEYFIGSMVSILKSDEDGKYYEVVDGQQRITTLLLLFGAMKCFLLKQKDIKGNQTNEFLEFINRSIQEFEVLIYNKKSSGISFVPELKLKINRDYGYDFNIFFKNLVDCSDDEPIKELPTENKQVINRYERNYKFFIKKIEEYFLDKNNNFTVEKAQLFSQFAQFLRIRVAMIVITTPSFNSAYFIFEVLNNRGLPLSNKDLTRNLIISEFIKVGLGENDSAVKWYELEENYIFPLDFIGRWVESKKASQQQYSAFNDLEKLYKDNYQDTVSKKKIENFYEDFKTDLGYFDFIEDSSKIENKYLSYQVLFLKLCNNLRYTTNFLLAAMRHFKFDGKQNKELSELLKVYEQFVLHTLLKPYKRFSTVKVYEAISFLNKSNRSGAEKSLLLEQNEKNELKELINGDIDDNYLGKLLIAKYFWIEDCKREDVVDVELNFDKATLEHIYPQSPAPKSKWLKDENFSQKFKTKYIYKLGNMTLLLHKVNSSIKNGDFVAKKKLEYQKTKLWLTQEIGSQKDIEAKYITDRHKKIVDTLIADLGI